MSDELRRALDGLVQDVADQQDVRARAGDDRRLAAMTSRAHRNRVRRTALVSAVTACAVVAVAAGGIAVATWDRAEPQPAAPPTTTSPAPTPTPKPEPTATSPAAVQQDATTTGGLRPYPAEPSVAWTVGLDQSGMLGDTTSTGTGSPETRWLEAGGTWLTVFGFGAERRFVAVDAATGVTRWTWEPGDGPGTVLGCGGVHDDVLVCLVRTADGSVVQLRDPATGAAVRDIAPGGLGLAVVGDTLLVHDLVTSTDVRVTLYDLSTGTVRDAVDLVGQVDPTIPGGDGGPVYWQRTGSTVLVHGPGYEFAVDTSTGAVLGRGLTRIGLRGDGWVTGTAADGSSRAVGAAGHDIVLPGPDAPGPMEAWVPADGVAVPLLSGSDAFDDEPDAVYALDPGTGDTLWSYPGASSVVAVVGETAVVGTGYGTVGLDLTSGAELWQTGPATVTGFDGERILLTAYLRVWAIDAVSGTEVWESAPPLGGVVRVGDSLALTEGDRIGAFGP